MTSKFYYFAVIDVMRLVFITISNNSVCKESRKFNNTLTFSAQTIEF